MHTRYHAEITRRALEGKFSQPALEAILRANLRQDRLCGQIGHPEYHFDNNGLAEGRAYMAQQRAAVLAALAQGQPRPAWGAFGRLIHAAQDFYAHSNYVRLWLDHHAPLNPNSQILNLNSPSLPPNSQLLNPNPPIDPLDPAILAHPPQPTHHHE